MTPFGLYIILKRRWDGRLRAPHPPSGDPNMRNPSIVPGARVPNGSSGGASPPDLLCCASRAPMELLAEVGPRHAEAYGAVQAERFREVWKVICRFIRAA